MSAAQPTPSSSAGAMPLLDPTFFDDAGEDALGFECANPALQIERWGQDDSAVTRE